MLARLARTAPLALAFMLSACSSPKFYDIGVPTGARFPAPSAAPGGLAGLVGSSNVVSQEEAELRDLQKRPTAIAFPARVGVLFYEYQDPLKKEDHQVVLDQLGADMVAGGLVTNVAQLPSNLARQGDSLEALRKLAARFQVDVLLLVSGGQSFDRADSQPATGIFNFGSQTAFEARSTLTGLAVGVYSGTFLTPYEVVGKAGPETLDPNAGSFGADQYRLRKAAHEIALKRLKDDFVAGLGRTKAAQDAAPLASPVPSAGATPTPDTAASPSPGGFTSPGGSPTPSPSPTTVTTVL